MSAQEAIKLLAVGNWNEMLDRVITSYQDYKKGHDLVILEGITTGKISNANPVCRSLHTRTIRLNCDVSGWNTSPRILGL